jgi:hypothetical protein
VPQSHTITIKSTLNAGGQRTGYHYDPPQLPANLKDPNTAVVPDDEVIWKNADTQAHWPAVTGAKKQVVPNQFMPNQIAPNSSSTAWIVDKGSVGTLTYFDCNDTAPNRPTGTIVITTLAQS